MQRRRDAWSETGPGPRFARRPRILVGCRIGHRRDPSLSPSSSSSGALKRVEKGRDRSCKHRGARELNRTTPTSRSGDRAWRTRGGLRFHPQRSTRARSARVRVRRSAVPSTRISARLRSECRCCAQSFRRLFRQDVSSGQRSSAKRPGTQPISCVFPSSSRVADRGVRVEAPEPSRAATSAPRRAPSERPERSPEMAQSAWRTRARVSPASDLNQAARAREAPRTARPIESTRSSEARPRRANPDPERARETPARRA